MKNKSKMQAIINYKNKMDKKAFRLTKKMLKAKINRKKKIYHAIIWAPKVVEITVNIIFIVIVFGAFYMKAKDPNFATNLTDKVKQIGTRGVSV